MHHTHRKGEGSHTHDRVSYWGKYTSSSGQWWKDHLSTQTPKDYVWICRCAPDVHSWGVKLSCDQQQVSHVIGKLSLPLLHCIVDLTPLQWTVVASWYQLFNGQLQKNWVNWEWQATDYGMPDNGESGWSWLFTTLATLAVETAASCSSSKGYSITHPPSCSLFLSYSCYCPLHQSSLSQALNLCFKCRRVWRIATKSQLRQHCQIW